MIKRKNRNRSWAYGYDKEYDIIIISKTGQIGEVIVINGLLIALPACPNKIESTSNLTYNEPTTTFLYIMFAVIILCSGSMVYELFKVKKGG